MTLNGKSLDVEKFAVAWATSSDLDGVASKLGLDGKDEKVRALLGNLAARMRKVGLDLQRFARGRKAGTCSFDVASLAAAIAKAKATPVGKAKGK